MIALSPDFKEFIQLLNSGNVSYLLVGGYAVALHGYVRYTSDIDFWVGTSPENAHLVIESLTRFGLPEAFELFEVLQQKKRVIGIGIPPNKIEVITSIDGVDFETCYQNKLVIEIDNITLNYISLPDLVKNKKASGRYKDLNDLEHLPIP